MRVYEEWEEPEDHGAVCAIEGCGKEIDLDDCGSLVEDVVQTADGEEAMVFLAVCKECEAASVTPLDSDNES